MKLKNMLCIISLFSMAAMDAKVIGGKPAGYNPGVTPPSNSTPTQQQPNPIEVKRAPVTNKFQSLLQKIRSSNVINANGEISASLIQEVQDADLAPEQKQALLQAAVTVKLPLTSANNDDTVEMIGRAMRQAGGSVGNQQPQGEIVTEAFYNPKTNLFDRLFLDSQAKFAQSDNLTQAGAEKSLMNELMPMITNTWKKRNIAVSIKQVDAAREQIIAAVAQIYKASPQNANPAKGWDKDYWYDRQTHLFNQKFLDEQTKNIVEQEEDKNPSARILASQLVADYSTDLISLWQADKVNEREYKRKLSKQVEDSFTKAIQIQEKAEPAQQAPAVQEPAEEVVAPQKPAEKTYEEEALLAVSVNQAKIKEEIIQNKPEATNENLVTAIENILEAKPDLVGKGKTIAVANLISGAFVAQGDALLPAQKGNLIRIIYAKFPGLK